MDDLTPPRRHLLRMVNDLVEPVIRRGWLGPVALGAGLVSLETIGRTSGRTRSRPVVAFRAGDHLVVGTVRRRSDWMANLADEPDAVVSTRGGPKELSAQVHSVPGVGRLAVLRADDTRAT